MNIQIGENNKCYTTHLILYQAVNLFVCFRLSMLRVPHTKFNADIKKWFSVYQTANIDTDVLLNIKNDNSESNICELIKNISSNIKTRNKVHKKDIVDAISLLSSGKIPDKKNSLVLIKACSSFLVDESPLGRMLLLNKLLNTLGYSFFSHSAV